MEYIDELAIKSRTRSGNRRRIKNERKKKERTLGNRAKIRLVSKCFKSMCNYRISDEEALKISWQSVWSRHNHAVFDKSINRSFYSFYFFL